MQMPYGRNMLGTLEEQPRALVGQRRKEVRDIMDHLGHTK